jgi:hypothetical protein
VAVQRTSQLTLDDPHLSFTLLTVHLQSYRRVLHHSALRPPFPTEFDSWKGNSDRKVVAASFEAGAPAVTTSRVKSHFLSGFRVWEHMYNTSHSLVNLSQQQLGALASIHHQLPSTEIHFCPPSLHASFRPGHRTIDRRLPRPKTIPLVLPIKSCGCIAAPDFLGLNKGSGNSTWTGSQSFCFGSLQAQRLNNAVGAQKMLGAS